MDNDNFIYEVKDVFITTFQVYSLTLVVPIVLSIVNIIFCGILDFHSIYGFLGNFRLIWIDYYFTGELIGVMAYKWHLALLFIFFLLSLTKN